MPVPYGCYCGPWTETNSDPVDEFDELCKRHDECYTEVELQGCKNPYDEYIAPYSWELVGSENEVMKIEYSDLEASIELKTCSIEYFVIFFLYRDTC